MSKPNSGVQSQFGLTTSVDRGALRNRDAFPGSPGMDSRNTSCGYRCGLDGLGNRRTLTLVEGIPALANHKRLKP